MDGHAASQTLPAAPAGAASSDTKTLKDTSKPEGVAKRTKSRNGCRECKAKRLKCDETKPDCQQCTRRGKQCPGYVKDFRFSAKHERLHSTGKQPRRGGKASASASTAAVRRPSHTLEPPPSPAIPTTNHTGQILDFIATPSAAPPANHRSLTTPSPGPPSHASSSPRSGYLSWAEVLSPAPTVDEDEPDEPRLRSPQPQSPGNVAVDTGMAEALPSPVSLLDSPGAVSRSLVPSRQIARASPKLLYTPVDLPSTLIEYWFTSVSSMWSAYDSPQNPNRQLALSNHSNSESVYYALQSMSAAYRVDSLPHLKPILTNSLANAMAAIRRELDIHYELMPAVQPQLPVDLLLAMFAMATSLCWTDTSQLGEQLVVGARALLDLYGMAESAMDEADRKHLQHFRHALTYLEMLHKFVNPNASGSLKQLRRRRSSAAIGNGSGFSLRRHSMGAEYDHAKDYKTLHPWTGVSGEIQERFGLVMALCREHLRNRNRGRQYVPEDEDVASNVELAQELVQDLSAISFHPVILEDDEPQARADTGDSRTPVSHLIDTAEAYKLAALLQLHLAFDELDVRTTIAALEIPELTGSIDDLPRHHALVVLALKLVTTLRRIPADSGTRCIQPVLYISAATGLKFDMPVTSPAPDLTVTRCTYEVSKAREFIVDRLVTWQRSLPPRPISVALRLIKAIWEEYDYGGQRHWVDVMRENSGLQTLFG